MLFFLMMLHKHRNMLRIKVRYKIDVVHLVGIKKVADVIENARKRKL
jgi:hypothetical protein